MSEEKNFARELVTKFTHSGFVNWSAAKKDAMLLCEEMKAEWSKYGDTLRAYQRLTFWDKILHEIKSWEFD